ncbi:hypothetical protein [Streptomyces sp. JJ36]|uniref:hypothetical protein n=1 Tax=Streptomyces sp. JJ36 TaxID=2736645 RepID=UPI002795F0ED|nr:hypothetical protein [Streptomyces sp. JJ36]MCF6524593.1 hypothetical protein [Streptomyces sp. JJ36]
MRPLPAALRRAGEPGQTARRGRDLARAGADGVRDVLHPLVTVGRGLVRLTTAGRAWWERTPAERRSPVLGLGGLALAAAYLLPYGPAVAVGAVLLAAAWQGRKPPPEPDCTGPGEEELARLQALYEALVPCFALPEDPAPEPLYAPDGSWERAFEEFAFTPESRIERLLLRYPPWFRDGEPEERHRVERLLRAKAGRGREYRFVWEEERNRLELSVPEPLPADLCAQRFVVAPGETVLGFTDTGAVRRTLPVADGAETRDVPPVVWRTGPRSTEPHLLALGNPGSGITTLLRSVVLQALPHGDVLVTDGGGAGEFASLAGRHGVLAVESSLTGALSALEWAAHETERRLLAAQHARQTGRPLPGDVRRPLWVVVDRPAVLSHLARAEGRPDPQELLEVPLRHGRAAGVTVVVADQFEGAEGLSQAVRAYTRARVVLGAASVEQVRAVLGETPHTTPAPDPPPGRGYARLGGGPVLRMQVPATPDPYDDAAGERQRQAVQALLPEHSGQVAPVG